jgi:putative hydrolase of the HAD superfamily
MIIRGIIFDVNGTLIDILTDESDEGIYRAIGHFLSYQGIYLHRGEVRDLYAQILDKQRRASPEVYFEFDAVQAWRELLELSPGAVAALAPEKLTQMPLFLAEMYRGISRRRLRLYPEVRDVLDEMHSRFKLAVLSDAQSAWARPELRAVGIDSYFDPIVISGDYGFRKPDRRLFEITLAGMRLAAEDVVFVGDDMYRDIFGAGQLGMKTVFFAPDRVIRHSDGVDPDYIIYRFAELPQAISLLEHQRQKE